MKRRSASLLFLSLSLSLAACSGGPANTNAAAAPDSVAAAKDSLPAPAFTLAMVDNKKDPSCGMPLTAGIGDTIHRNGKVLGFCSKECKDEFLKDTTAGMKKVEFKK